MATSGAQVDAGAAASMISRGTRKNNGLGAVTVDPALMKIAAEHAHAMASRRSITSSAAAASTSGSRARAMTQTAYDMAPAPRAASVLRLARLAGHRANACFGAT